MDPAVFGRPMLASAAPPRSEISHLVSADVQHIWQHGGASPYVIATSAASFSLICFPDHVLANCA
jgi:hypothetical protein